MASAPPPYRPPPQAYQTTIRQAEDNIARVTVNRTRPIGMVSRQDKIGMDRDFLSVMLQELTGPAAESKTGQFEFLTSMHNKWSTTRQRPLGFLKAMKYASILTLIGVTVAANPVVPLVVGLIGLATAVGSKMAINAAHENKSFIDKAKSDRLFEMTHHKIAPPPTPEEIKKIYPERLKATYNEGGDAESIYQKDRLYFERSRKDILATQYDSTFDHSRVDKRMEEVFNHIGDVLDRTEDRMKKLKKDSWIPIKPDGQHWNISNPSHILGWSSSKEMVKTNEEQLAKIRDYWKNYGDIMGYIKPFNPINPHNQLNSGPSPFLLGQGKPPTP